MKIQLISKLKWTVFRALLDGRLHLTSYDPEIPLLQISRSLKVGGYKDNRGGTKTMNCTDVPI